MPVAALVIAVVVGMALAIAEISAGELRRTAADAAVHQIEAIVRGYVDPAITEDSLGIGAPATPGIGDELDRLTISGDIRQISIWSRDGRIAYSTDDLLRGRRFSIGDLVATAFLGTSISAYGPADAALLPGHTNSAQSNIEIYVPIRGTVDGNPIGVYMVEQDARTINERVDSTRKQVFLVALVAATVVLAIVALAFTGASALLARRNALLRRRAETERLLAQDLRRSEERFRSLVRNASDIILICGADGLIRYESPAVARVLGFDPDERVGRSLYDSVHTADLSWIRSLVADVSRREGAEVTAEFRAAHADGSWRWLEATIKNLAADPAVGGIVVNYRDVTERRSLENQLRHQAFHDALTGLPNRALLLDRLEHALTRARREPASLAVLFLDLDDFKAVNDSLGHQAGDELLVAVAERVRHCLRDADTCARMGGDEFAIVLEDAVDLPDSVRVGERILASLREPFRIAEKTVHIQGSVGVAAYDGPDQTADEMLRLADVAMYAAKSRGKDRLTVYQAVVHSVAIDRHQLRADLHAALENGQLNLLYQPIVALSDWRVLGAEALLRWNHPMRGVIGPAEFVPLAEESGLVVAIGRWVIGEACRQVRAWRDARRGGEELNVSVNVSGRQVADVGLAAFVAEALREHALEPQALTLEITESVLLDDADTVVTWLHQLKALGIRLAIDDFGTGYSSLSYLRFLPVDALKIDRAFVAEVETSEPERAVVRSIVSLSQVLGLQTVAEGIETDGQLAELRAMGAQLGQGYLFAEPLTPAAMSAFVRHGMRSSARSRPTPARARPSRGDIRRRRDEKAVTGRQHGP